MNARRPTNSAPADDLSPDTDGWIAWLRTGLAHAGRTQRGLALALGVDASAISRLLHGRRRLRAHEIPVAARYLGLDPTAPMDRQTSPADAAARSERGAASSNDLWIPLLGVAAGSAAEVDPDLFLLNDAEPIDHVRRPDGLIGRPRAFALQVIGTSMVPRYEPGDVVAVDPDQTVEIGTDVVIVLDNGAAIGTEGQDRDQGPRRLLLKQLIARTPTSSILAQHNPPRRDIAIPADRVQAIWPVLALRTVLGL